MYQKYLDQQNSIKVQQLPYQERIIQPERENKEVKRANEILLKTAQFLPGGAQAHTKMLDFIHNNKDLYGVEAICKIFSDRSFYLLI